MQNKIVKAHKHKQYASGNSYSVPITIMRIIAVVSLHHNAIENTKASLRIQSERVIINENKSTYHQSIKIFCNEGSKMLARLVKRARNALKNELTKRRARAAPSNSSELWMASGECVDDNDDNATTRDAHVRHSPLFPPLVLGSRDGSRHIFLFPPFVPAES